MAALHRSDVMGFMLPQTNKHARHNTISEYLHSTQTGRIHPDLAGRTRGPWRSMGRSMHTGLHDEVSQIDAASVEREGCTTSVRGIAKVLQTITYRSHSHRNMRRCLFQNVQADTCLTQMSARGVTYHFSTATPRHRRNMQ